MCSAIEVNDAAVKSPLHHACDLVASDDRFMEFTAKRKLDSCVFLSTRRYHCSTVHVLGVGARPVFKVSLAIAINIQ